MLQWKNSAVIAIVLFFTLMSIVLWTKPAFLYDREKKAYKSFRTGTGGTIFPLWIVAIFFGIVSYALTVWILRTTTTTTSSPPSSPTGDLNRVLGGLGANNSPPSMSMSIPMQMPMQPMTMQVPMQPMMTMPMPMSMYSMAPPLASSTPPPVVMSGGGGSGSGGGSGGGSGSGVGGNDLYDVSRSRVWRNF